MKSSHRSLATSIELDPKAAETKRSRLAAAGSLALRSKLPILSVAVMGITGLMLGGTALAAPPPTPIGLGTAANTAVEAGQSITNTGVSTITGTGDASVSPGSSATFFAQCGPGDVNCVNYTSGHLHVTDGTANQQVADAHTALLHTQSLGGQAIPAQLGGATLPAGIYTTGAADIAMNTTLQLDAAFNPKSVWIFNATSTITANPNSTVVFINQGSASDVQLACNVFWTTASSATLNGPTFVGTVMAQTAITVGDSVTVTGRLLSGTANATLIHDTIIQPQNCSVGAAGTGGGPGSTGGGSIPTGGGPSSTGGGLYPYGWRPVEHGWGLCRYGCHFLRGSCDPGRGAPQAHRLTPNRPHRSDQSRCFKKPNIGSSNRCWASSDLGHVPSDAGGTASLWDRTDAART